MRTTIDIADSVLRELKRRQAQEGKSLGELVSEVLAQAIKSDCVAEPVVSSFEWTSKSMTALIDLDDKEAIRRALNEP